MDLYTSGTVRGPLCSNKRRFNIASYCIFVLLSLLPTIVRSSKHTAKLTDQADIVACCPTEKCTFRIRVCGGHRTPHAAKVRHDEFSLKTRMCFSVRGSGRWNRNNVPGSDGCFPHAMQHIGWCGKTIGLATSMGAEDWPKTRKATNQRPPCFSEKKSRFIRIFSPLFWRAGGIVNLLSSVFPRTVTAEGRNVL